MTPPHRTPKERVFPGTRGNVIWPSRSVNQVARCTPLVLRRPDPQERRRGIDAGVGNRATGPVEDTQLQVATAGLADRETEVLALGKLHGLVLRLEHAVLLDLDDQFAGGQVTEGHPAPRIGLAGPARPASLGATNHDPRTDCGASRRSARPSA